MSDPTRPGFLMRYVAGPAVLLVIVLGIIGLGRLVGWW